MARRRALSAALLAFAVGACGGNHWAVDGGDGDGDADGDADADGDGDADAAPDADEPAPPADADTGADADDGFDIGGGDAPDTVIPRALLTPRLDGALSEWPPLRYLLDGESAALRYGPDTRPARSDGSVEFDLRWDAAALYFAARFTDDSAWADSEMVWQDDSVELYVDGDNNDAVPTYDANDHQYTLVRDLRLGDHGTPIDPAARGIVRAVRDEGATFTVELAVPWTELGGTPSAGRLLGIDVAFNDDDDGGEEDTHLVMWLAHEMTELGSPVQDTSLFRDLALAD
jgi:hypothetical protein